MTLRHHSCRPSTGASKAGKTTLHPTGIYSATKTGTDSYSLAESVTNTSGSSTLTGTGNDSYSLTATNSGLMTSVPIAFNSTLSGSGSLTTTQSGAQDTVDTFTDGATTTYTNTLPTLAVSTDSYSLISSGTNSGTLTQSRVWRGKDVRTNLPYSCCYNASIIASTFIEMTGTCS